MTESHSTSAREDRRTRWAREENARRIHRYDQELAAWQADAAELDWMLAAARTFAGIHDSQLDLKRNELAFFELPDARIVEEPAGRSIMPGPADFNFQSAKVIRGNIPAHEGTVVTGSPIVKAGDMGRLTVTNHRVVLQGHRNNREWSYAKLIDLGHDERRPLTLMHVSNRQKVSGLLYDASTAARFRFFLGLALAHFQGNPAEFTAGLEQQRFHHVGSAPTAPIAATPLEAPNGSGLPAFGRGVRTAYTGKASWPRKVRVLWGVVAVSATLLAGGAVASASQPAPATHHQTKFVSSSSTVVAKPSHTAASIATTAKAPAKPTTRRTTVAHTPAPRPTVTPKPTPARTTALPTPPPSTVQAPPPPPSVVQPPPPSSAPAASCYPLTNGGNCYEPGQKCRNSDHGASGVAGDGKNITCEDNNGWRWEPTG